MGPQLVRKGFAGGLIAAVKGPYRVCGWCKSVGRWCVVGMCLI